MKKEKKLTPLLTLRIAIIVYAIISAIIDTATGYGAIYLFYGASLIAVVLFTPIIFKSFGLKISDATLFIGFIFCTIAIYAGNRFDLYKTLWWYDSALHFSSGIIVAFAAKDLFFKSEKPESLSPIFTFIIIVMFAISVAAIWEIAEFFFDIVTMQDVQRNLTIERELFGASWQNTGTKDIMNDMILGTLGGFIGASIALHLKKK